ncbi:MAG: Rne/Rng family ribonuclease [Planctomycetota bacterium]|nr:Rne/Rng family ribonuclease [Planctomycetota bacterium]
MTDKGELPSSAELIAVNARDPEEVRVARAQSGQLLELRWTRSERGSLVGSILLGVVTRVEEGLDAAFVDLGLGRAGFLHRDQVLPALSETALDPVAAALRTAPRPGGGEAEAEADAESSAAAEPAMRISELLRPGRRVLVQVLRDPLRQKGATLTTFVSLAGHRLVFMPSLGRPGVSRRLADEEERTRLRTLLAEVAGVDQGLIARTAAEGADAHTLGEEWRALKTRWDALALRASHQSQPGPVLEEESTIVRSVRELLGTGIREIVVDEPGAERELREALAHEAETITIRAYANSRPLFEALDLERDWQSLFRPRVPLPGGGSLVIHETEALTAVDINSGPTQADSLEGTALEANLGACEEIARQTRLRDLGGIVVIDFIDMRLAENRRRVENALREALRRDRARLKTGQLGSFGLMAFTRRRIGGGLPRALETLCRGCGGSGHVAHHHAGALRALRRMRSETAAQSFRVRAQPGTCLVLRGALGEALRSLGCPVELVDDLQVAAGDPVVQAELLAGPEGTR